MEDNPFLETFAGDEPTQPVQAPAPAAPQTDANNPFLQTFADEQEPPVETGAPGAFMHHAERGILPSITGMTSAGIGAQVGVEVGGATGMFVAGPPGAMVLGGLGGLIGGIGGFMGGDQAMTAAQDWLIKQLPESMQELLGQSEKQQAAEEEQQPIASQIGTLAPFVLTMRSSLIGPRAAAPAEDASVLRRAWNSPVTAPILSAAMQGGTEAVSEVTSGQKIDPSRIAIATAFGLMFDRPTTLGERLTMLGEHPVRLIIGRGEPVPVAPLAEETPTLAQAADAQVLGPGITEGVFLGSEKQDPSLREAQQTAAQVEADALSPPTPQNPVDVARTAEPELFAHYDELQAQQADLQERLSAVDAEETDADAAEAIALRHHLNATSQELWRLAPEIAAAHRRAADVVQSPTVEPPAPEPVQPTQPAPEGQTPTAGAPTAPSRETLDAEQASIAQQVTANLIAAGRSPEEAAAGGQLLGHYYRTRSAKFKGALGSPMELFNQQGPTIRRYGASVAPLMPTEARPTIAPEKAPEIIPQNIPGEIAQQAQPVAVPENAPRVSGTPASEIEALDPSNITVDASRFQFKAGGDEQGVSERLQGVEKWDPRLAGTALVFRDAEGKNWIADGHQRIGLAKRLMEGGHPPIKINAFVLDAKDGITDADARAIAAAKNIAEGTGSSVDAAKVIRDAREKGIDLPPLPPRSALTRDGYALAELGQEAFGLIVNEVVPTQQGAIVGRLVKNPAQQVEALRLLAAIKPENVTQAEMVVRDMLSSGTEMTTQGTLFGDEAFASSIVRERAKIADESLKLLRRDKQTFRTLVDEAERIQGAGANVLDQTANRVQLSTDEQAADFLKQLAFRAGPVSDALSAVARQLKAGEIKPGDAARSFLESVRRAIESGVVEGTDAGGAEPSAGGQRPVDEGPTFFQGRKPEPWRPGEMFGGFDTERGLEGLPQTLIPGVKPLTDVERIAAEAAKPLKGGAAPPKPGSLFDEQGREDSAAQRELFQPAYHGTPHIFDKFDSSKIGTGEGAQAFGHGLYFAGRKEVAKYYRDTLAGREDPYEWRGEKWDSNALAKRISNAVGDSNSIAVLGALRDIRNGFTREQVKSSLSEKHAPMVDFLFDGGIRSLEPNKGRLLHVDVPEPHELLDWDKPLSEQPSQIRRALEEIPTIKKYIEDRHDVDGFDPSGSELYKVLSDRVGGDAAASAALREAGIPGHRFLDQQSRVTPEEIKVAEQGVQQWTERLKEAPGDPTYTKRLETAKAHLARLQNEEGRTHNYVIYDDSRVNILNYEQQKRGSIGFPPGRKPLIRLFAEADASTFFHETGHQWLEDLMRDSAHAAAPDEIKADAQTVRKWLGIEEGKAAPGINRGGISREQHEKFATGFEQYLREGVAPSPGLARIFAQFKTWLTQIYQSIKGLGTPINEDIRGVFDRLLAEEPNRTVIAPEELERGPSLHDIHEAEAEDVTPTQAGPVGDRISAERDDYRERQPIEVKNEIEPAKQKAESEAAGTTGTEPPGEAGAGPGGSSAMGERGSEPVPEPTGGTSGGQPSPQLGGGGEGIPEGVNGAELRNNGPGVAGDARTLPPEPEPAVNRAARFVDKAGNIRLDNINTTDDVKQVLRDMAEQNNGFIDYRRGVLSKGQILDMATAIGETDPDFLLRRRIGQAFNAEEIKYAEKILAQSAQKLAVMMKPGAGATPEEVRAYAEARSRHKMLQAQFSGVTAESGRAQAALRRTQSFWSPEAAAADKAARESTGRTLFQLQQEMALGAELDTPEKISRFIRDQDKKNAVDGILEYWISAILSGTKTMLVNIAGNGITAVNHFGPDVAAAALAGRVYKALGREGTRVHVREIPVAAQAAGERGIPIGVKAMLDAFKAGRGVDLPEQTENPTLPFVESAHDLFKGPALDEGATYQQIVPEVYGMVRGTIDAAIANGKLLASGGVQGSPLVSLRDTATGVIPNLSIRGVEVPVGDAVRLPLRSLSAHDSFFRAANYTIEKARTAYRTALEERLQPNTPAFARRVAQVSDNFTPEQMTEASDVAHGLTFMGRRGPFTSALVRLANSRPFNMPLPKFIVPFVSTPLAIIESAVVHRTPLAFLAPEVRADLMGTNGNIAQDMAVGRLLMGTLYGVAGAGLASMGLLSGSGPSNSNDAAAWRQAGNQAHSVRIGEMWYQINQLGPLGLWLSMVADGHDVAGSINKGDWGAVFSGIQQAFAQNVVDMSSLTGVSDLMQAIQDPGRYGNNYVSKFLSSFVPAIVAQAAKSADPYQRAAQGILESARARIPFASQDLPVRRDIWGQPLPQNLPAYGLIYSAKVQTDPLNRAFLDGGYWPGYPDRNIRGVKLTEGQYDDYSTVAGRLLRQNLAPMVTSPQWGSLPEAKKHDILSKAVIMSRNSAREYMQNKYPSIPIAATRAKQGLDATP